MPERYAVLATGRSKVTDDTYRREVEQALKQIMPENEWEAESDFLSSFHYTDLDPSVLSDYNRLPDKLEIIRQNIKVGGNMLFYLSVTAGALWSHLPRNLALQGLNNEGDGWKRDDHRKAFRI
ncbi:MAG: hypothetical protein U5L72_08290 [Bacteroidales bacterium]|nr:hypothetical protein [Bacteroidales bacterium]